MRRATAERHARLDQGMPLAAAEPGLADYAAHLSLLHAWLLPLQTWMQGFDDGPQQAGFFPDAPYCTLMAQDLAHPALAPFPCADVGAIDNTAWPRHASAAYRWGVCYVVEGSQLGGAVLYKRLAGRLAPHPLHYLRGTGSTGARWKNFMSALHQAVADEEAITQACEGACDAFDRLIDLHTKRESHA